MTTVRLATPDDAEAVRAIYAPIVRDTAVSFEHDPPGADEIRERIDRTLPAYPWLVCERDGAVVGYTSAGSHRKRGAYRWSVDVSVYVHPDHRRAGIGRTLYESLFAVLRLQGFYNAYAGIALPNPASIGLHRSIGFERVGVYERVGYKHGAWRDIARWVKALREHEPDPDPPMSVEELGADEVEGALSPEPSAADS